MSRSHSRDTVGMDRGVTVNIEYLALAGAVGQTGLSIVLWDNMPGQLRSSLAYRHHKTHLEETVESSAE